MIQKWFINNCFFLFFLSPSQKKIAKSGEPLEEEKEAFDDPEKGKLAEEVKPTPEKKAIVEETTTTETKKPESEEKEEKKSNGAHTPVWKVWNIIFREIST